MNTLHLTTEEQGVYAKLSDALREGWDVQTEMGTYQDSEEKFSMRIALLRLHDSKLLDFQKRAVGLSSDQLASLILGMNLKDVEDDDLAELFFAVGSSVMTSVIGGLLPKSKTDSDMEDISALAAIRHSILQSYSHDE